MGNGVAAKPTAAVDPDAGGKEGEDKQQMGEAPSALEAEICPGDAALKDICTISIDLTSRILVYCAMDNRLLLIAAAGAPFPALLSPLLYREMLTTVRSNPP